MAFTALRPIALSSRIQLPRCSRATPLQMSYQHGHQQRRSISLSSYVVTPKELDSALKKNVRTKISTSPRVIPLCASWFLPNDPQARTGIEVFKKRRIPQARFFDLDEIKDLDSPYPHMLPTKETFDEAMRSLGIRKDDEIVVYDSEELGLFSAPRVGWTLKVFGHSNVHILNNFRLWVKEGYPTESGEVEPVERSNYEANSLNSDMVVHFPEINGIAQDHGKEGSDGIQILDARPQGRWAGKDKEPRPGLSSGHIPGSQSLAFSELLEPETKTLLSTEELRKLLEAKGVDPTKTTISMCGTGVTAAVIDLALEETGYVPPENKRIYDGSWTEWAQRVPENSGLIRKE
ncbi:hypothetical protein AJ80_00290 [Polytolypa hystricis UAMH7299]|uniref:Rhodanese domain-containing protein n=1 Tax=Polytolypa hystricis (strain UAMH7299) TaxID=1447883 RepID=A0A2B7Z353_POLH7|nr:hypothetical protein AJ80_00290 [Polytolypa hystricis UAMH7299]